MHPDMVGEEQVLATNRCSQARCTGHGAAAATGSGDCRAFQTDTRGPTRCQTNFNIIDINRQTDNYYQLSSTDFVTVCYILLQRYFVFSIRVPRQRAKGDAWLCFNELSQVEERSVKRTKILTIQLQKGCCTEASSSSSSSSSLSSDFHGKGFEPPTYQEYYSLSGVSPAMSSAGSSGDKR